MLLRHTKYLNFIFILACLYACRHPYEPSVIRDNVKYLVVNGFINTGPNAVSSIILSRTQNLSDSGVSTPEPGAQVTIESDAGDNYSLFAVNDSVYNSNPLNLNPAAKYRLHIRTLTGKTYSSDYVPVKQTPPIDSVTWEQNNDVNIFVNTHDPQNNTWYYHYDFVETWEYKSTLSGAYGLNGNNIIVKDASTQTDSCWQNLNSNTVNVASSIALNADVISHHPVTTVQQNSVKISVRYSILVQQYALTQEAYQYRLNLQNNTQSMGSIFDPQPSQLFSNIHNESDASEPVIGFVSASSVATKRIFIDHAEVQNWNYPGILIECKVIAANQNPGSYLFFNYDDTTYYPYYFSSNILMVAKRFCLDCQWYGGTTNRPSFW